MAVVGPASVPAASDGTVHVTVLAAMPALPWRGLTCWNVTLGGAGMVTLRPVLTDAVAFLTRTRNG